MIETIENDVDDVVLRIIGNSQQRQPFRLDLLTIGGRDDGNLGRRPISERDIRSKNGHQSAFSGLRTAIRKSRLVPGAVNATREVRPADCRISASGALTAVNSCGA